MAKPGPYTTMLSSLGRKPNASTAAGIAAGIAAGLPTRSQKTPDPEQPRMYTDPMTGQVYHERIYPEWMGEAGRSALDRNADIESGYAKGRELFYNNPDMQMMRQTRMDLSKGYDGAEMGALRQEARSELAGQRGQYLRQMASRAARGGVGGARAAAMQNAADQGFAKTRAEQERKMLLDNAQLRRQGASDLEQFLMRQRFGELSTGLGYGQLGVADRTGQKQAEAAERAAAAANQPGNKGFFSQILDSLF